MPENETTVLPMLLVGPPESRRAQRRLGINTYLPPAGAIKVPCSRCGHKLWLGPKQRQAQADDPAVKAVCSGCALPDLRAAAAGTAGAALTHLGGAGGDYAMTNGTRHGPDHGNRN